MDIREKIQEQLGLLLDCDDSIMTDIYIRRIKTMMEVDEFEFRENSRTRMLSECKVFNLD